MSTALQIAAIDAVDPVEAGEIVIAQMLEFASRRVRPETVLVALGRGWSAERPPGWYDVQLALSTEWRAMHRPTPKRGARMKSPVLLAHGGAITAPRPHSVFRIVQRRVLRLFGRLKWRV